MNVIFVTLFVTLLCVFGKTLFQHFLILSRQDDWLGKKVYWAEDIPWATPLLNNWRVVRNEFLMYEKRHGTFTHSIHARDIYKSQSWYLPTNMELAWEAKVVHAPPYGFINKTVLHNFPKTKQLLDEIENAGVPVYNFAFVILPPNSAVNPHADMHPGVMHYFLTLETKDNLNHEVYISLHDDRQCPSSIYLQASSLLQNKKLIWSEYKNVTFDKNINYIPSSNSKWNLIDYKNGQGFLWDGFWHCHFVINRSNQRRVVLALLLEKTREFQPKFPFYYINRWLSTGVMPYVSFWRSFINSYHDKQNKGMELSIDTTTKTTTTTTTIPLQT